MQLNLSSDRLLHLLALVIASAFFGFIVHYWTESGLLFSCSGGVTIAVQLSNVWQTFYHPSEGEGRDDDNNTEKSTADGLSVSGSGHGRRPTKKQLKGIKRRKEKEKSSAAID
mmetsp:Transcript_18316/g.30548  ORF Transcript_18316/g.30548 Transcript_18316/m.30548 type:complete len:113 (-) Transcript_18316:295-633(-)